MDELKRILLKQIAGLEKEPQGAFNIRVNGKAEKRNSTKDISISPLSSSDGIEIRVRDGVKGQSVHIPVLITQAGLKDVVTNKFYIGKNCDITIVAGCGIHCGKVSTSEHTGLHSFKIGEGSKVKYIERHIGLGEKVAKKIMNPTTIINVGKNAEFTMETMQIEGIDESERTTKAQVNDNAKLIVKESIKTTLKQDCKTQFEVLLAGKNSSTHITSRAVALDNSKQHFVSNVIGDNECFGHVECDAIICDKARVTSTPALDAKSEDASLVHEAVIGKLAPEQVIKLMTLGLTEEEATEAIITGFLL